MKVCGTFLCLLFLINSCQYKTAEKEVKPNILVIMTDDQGWGDLSFHGNPYLKTPNIDLLASQSVRLNNFFVSPVCAPTRASLLTGRYHLRTGTSWVTHRREVMNASEVTIAELLKDNDYHTGIFGKWHNGIQYPNDPLGQGFDEFWGFSAGHWNNYFDTPLLHNDNMIQSEGFITDFLTDKAIEFIEDKKEKPFFCYVPYNAPHSPFQVPDPYFDKYKQLGLDDKLACVYAMCENIDDNVGRLLNTLDGFNLRENTIVVFLTDNGPNGQRYNGQMRGIKASVHEGGVRVPCFIQWGDHFKPKDVKTLTAHIDLFPTIAELVGMELSDSLLVDGMSLKNLLFDFSQQTEERAIFNIFNEGEDRMYPGSVRTNQYRLVIEHDQIPQLYDMVKDPGQQTDIAEEHPHLTDSLYQKLKLWYSDVSSQGIKAPPIPIGYSDTTENYLPAPEAELSVGLAFKGGRGWSNDWIKDWDDIGENVAWLIDVQENGEYEVILEYNCYAEPLPQFLMTTKKSQLTVEIPELHLGQEIESPDRVIRGEVYEKEWKKSSVGKLNLTKGTDLLNIELLNEMNKTAFELKSIYLKSVK